MIKIFISSTFSDMQSERDIIQKNVLPKLRHFSRRMGHDVSIVDLRWGISGEEMDSNEVMSKILSVCAEEIEFCQPYFVLLLGDRYGTLPNEVSLMSFLKKHPEIPAEMAKNKSITEIEAMLAIQKMTNSSKLIVCVRDPDLIDKIPQQYRSIFSDIGEKANLLSALKKKITSSGNVEIISYQADWDEEQSAVCGLNSFADQLTNALIRQITNNIGPTESSPEKEAEAFDNMLTSNVLKKYVPREEYITDIVSFANGNEDVLVLSGASGNGKTYLMAKAADTLSKTNDYKTISLFLGNGLYDFSIESILTNLIYRLNNIAAENVFIENTLSLSDLKTLSISLIKKISQTHKLVVFVDNISALQLEDKESFLANFPLPQSKTAYKLVVSSASTEPIATNALAGYNWRTIDILGVDEEKMQKIANNLLSEQGKELGNSELTAFYNSCLFRSPLYVSLALKRLVMMSATDFNNIHELAIKENVDGGNALSMYMIRLIENFPETEGSFADIIIDRLAEEIGIKNHHLLIDLIVAANEQLRAHDLVEIINSLTFEKITLLDFINLIRNAEEILTINDLDGRVQFSHSLFKVHFANNAVTEDRKPHNAIFNYIDGLENDDSVRIRLYLIIALYTENYPKALSFIKYVNERHAKGAYQELKPIFLSRDKRDMFINLLNKLAKFAAAQGPEDLNILASEYNGDIYHIINKAAYGRKDSEIQILELLYCLMKKHKNEAACGSEYNRTIYMIAEKCGLTTSDFENRCQYFGDFLKYCSEFFESLDESYKHRDFILSDLGYAYEKNATIAAVMHKWRDASKLYDLAIQTISNEIHPSTNKLDLLEYQKCSHIVDKYNMLMSDFYTKKRMGWDNQENLSTYCHNILPELLEVVAFCEKAVDNFIQNERCMVLARYIGLLMEGNLVLARYYNIIDEHYKEKDYLENALKAGYAHYRMSDDVISLDQIRFIELQLGLSDACCLDERLCYLQKANQKTLEIMQRISNQDMRSKMEKVLDEINGQMMRIVFMKIHPNINIESKEFLSKSGLVFARDATKITHHTFYTVVSLCRDYLAETDHSGRPEIFSYNSNYEKVVSGIYAGMIVTIQEAITFGAKKIHGDFVNAYHYIGKNPTEAKIRFQIIWDENQDLMEMTSRFTFKFVEKIPNKYTLLAAIQTADIAEKTAHNLKVFAYESEEHEKHSFWEEQEINLHADVLLYRMLEALLEGDAFPTEHEKKRLFHRFCPAITDMRLFAFCIEKGGKILEKYLDFVSGKEHKHWYNIYQELVLSNHKQVKKDMTVIGKYLCENTDELEIKRVLYHSIFYESLALEYAYKDHRKDIAEKIVYNGYDHYLELGTLYILRHYDRAFYHSVISDVKRICLIRGIKQTVGNCYIRNMYGDTFCDEFVKLAKKSLENLKCAEKDDPRLYDKRKTPNWAE